MEVGIGSLPFVEDLRKIGGTSVNDEPDGLVPNARFLQRAEPDLSYAEEDPA
jgi:hypothetical protein